MHEFMDINGKPVLVRASRITTARPTEWEGVDYTDVSFDHIQCEWSLRISYPEFRAWIGSVDAG